VRHICILARSYSRGIKGSTSPDLPPHLASSPKPRYHSCPSNE
jgi:hypothetical protein